MAGDAGGSDAVGWWWGGDAGGGSGEGVGGLDWGMIRLALKEEEGICIYVNVEMCTTYCGLSLLLTVYLSVCSGSDHDHCLDALLMFESMSILSREVKNVVWFTSSCLPFFFMPLALSLWHLLALALALAHSPIRSIS